MSLTNKNASFEDWMKELEQLQTKLGDQDWPDENYWETKFLRGLTANEALFEDLAGEEGR